MGYSIEYCYQPGAVWVARRSLRAFLDIPNTRLDNNNSIVIKRGEIILLLAYYMNLDQEEHIRFLYNTKTYYMPRIDAAYDFYIDPENEHYIKLLFGKKKTSKLKKTK